MSAREGSSGDVPWKRLGALSLRRSTRRSTFRGSPFGRGGGSDEKDVLKPIVLSIREGDSSAPALGIVVDLSAIKDSEKKEMFRKGKQACLAVPRSATMKDIKEQIKFVLENQQQKLSLFKDGAHLKDKHTFEDDAFFPQIKGVIRQKGMTTGSAFATAHPVTKDDVIATILVRCPTRLTRVEITDGISILIQGISNEYVVERQLDTAMPHFWKKGEQSSELVLFIDREWCGAAIDALLKFHTKISEPNLEVGGSVVPKDGFLDDRDTYPTALIDARLKRL